MDRATKGLIALAIIVWAVAGYFAATRQPAPPSAVVSASPVDTAPPPVTASATASTPPPEPRTPSRCMASLMAPDTFAKEAPQLEAICDEKNPFKAFTALKSAVVGAAGDHLTDGAREMAGLGWYEIATIATMRAKCCPSPPSLEWPFALACPIDKAVAELEKAMKTEERAAIDEALDLYRVQAICVYKFGQGKNFGRDAMPGSEKAAYDKVLARALDGQE